MESVVLNNRVQTFTRNEQGRDFVCSDLHGQYDLFIEQLQSVNFNSNIDRVFCVGDLIDRGPDSLDCLKLIMEPWFHSIRGNHEELMINGVSDPLDEQLWDRSGGKWHYDAKSDPEYHRLVEMVRDLPLVFELENQLGQKVGVCHAQCPFDDWKLFLNKVAERDSNAMADTVWSRTKIKNWKHITPVNGIDYVISGHTIVPEVVRFTNQIWIDAGAALGKKPTVLSIDMLDQLVDRLADTKHQD